MDLRVHVHVRISGLSLPWRQDIGAPCNAGADGWQYSYDLTAIHVCGPTCDALRADPSARLELVLDDR